MSETGSDAEHAVQQRGTGRRVRVLALGLIVAGAAIAPACGSRDDDAGRRIVPAPVERAVGSDRHLELRAQEAAERVRTESAAGSDRHLELRAQEAAERVRTESAAGSDRHLELRAQEAAERSGR